MSDLYRNHRTALFIDGYSYQTNEEYAERVDRLVESINGDNIKVDLFTVFDTPDTIVPGIATHTTGVINYDEVYQKAKNLGYTQTLISLA